MGIRVACPNGHRLNVKNELAGLRGVCPACGEAVAIPLFEAESTAPSAVQPPLSTEPAPEPQPSAPAPQPQAAAAGAKSSPPPEPPAAILWYVRDTAGQQWGPASAERFAQRMGDQPFGPESLVWRTGWEEWRVLGEVSDALPRADGDAPPPLPPANTMAKAAATVASPDVALSIPNQQPSPQAATDPIPAASLAAQRHQMKVRRRRRLQLWFSLSLLLVVVLLAGTVVVVFQSQNKPQPASPAATSQ